MSVTFLIASGMLPLKYITFKECMVITGIVFGIAVIFVGVAAYRDSRKSNDDDNRNALGIDKDMEGM